MLIKCTLYDTVKGNEFQRCVLIRKIFFWYSSQLKIGATQDSINPTMTLKEDKLVSFNWFARYGRLQLLASVLNYSRN